MIEGPERDLFVRGVRHAMSRDSGGAVDSALAGLGWLDAFALDERVTVSVVFETQGETNTTSGSLESLLATVALGARPPALLLPPLGLCGAPGRLEGGRCQIRGLGSSGLRDCDSAVVVTEMAGRLGAVSVRKGDLHLRPVAGLDPTLELVEVTGHSDEPEVVAEAVEWDAAVVLGHRAVGHELVGAARAMLELARAHASERIQFGRPIASFQAVRHRLSDSLVAVEAAASLLDAAWEDPSGQNASIAKSFAGCSARLVGRHCQQVLAGVGFTTEHPFHRYFRRTFVLDQLLGAGSMLTRRLGEEVLTTKHLPPVLSL